VRCATNAIGSAVQLYLISGTVANVIFRLQSTGGQPLYLQLMQQIRHAVESGALHDGDQLPGIRTLAEELVVSPNTIAKAYSELEHEGLLELHHGSGAFISVSRRARSLANDVQAASESVIHLVEQLRERNFLDEEIRRMFEAALLQRVEIARKR
jgi:GntR family transcriptional regulator